MREDTVSIAFKVGRSGCTINYQSSRERVHVHRSTTIYRSVWRVRAVWFC